MFYVYLLKWTSYYLWVTNDLHRRYAEHVDWKVYSTKRLWGDLKLVWYLMCESRDEALNIESKLKKSWHIGRIMYYEWFVKC